MNSKARVINIVSGKGGTGKTLFTAVLANMLGDSRKKVLAIDLDIFVRGLTVFLYHDRRGAYKVVHDGEVSVSEYFREMGKYLQKKEENDAQNSEESVNMLQDQFALKIPAQRFKAFDVWPSVGELNIVIEEFRDVVPNSFGTAKEILKEALRDLVSQYDYILIDSRAGYDELIAAIHCVSDMTICVEEDDRISSYTSDNLVRQLEASDDKERSENKSKRGKRIIQRVRNKAGKDKDNDDAIPFDKDIMDSFGEDMLWDVIPGSLYKDHLAKVWNAISLKMRNSGISGWDSQLERKRSSPVPGKKLESSLQMFNNFGRAIITVAILMIFLSIVMLVLASTVQDVGFSEMIPLASLVVGFSFLIYAIFINGRR